MLKSGNKIKLKQNASSGFKFMSRDRVSHIHYEIHMCMFPHVVTRDCKQHLEQLMITESLMGVYSKGVALQVAEPRYLISVITENNGVSERKQCFAFKRHVYNIGLHKSSFRNIAFTINFTVSHIKP